jgi:putative intracellular protease/amidase
MIQTSVATPLRPPPQPDTRESDLLDPLGRLAGDMTNARVLVVADHGLDLMCGLIRRGCLAATVLHPGDKPDADNYDVVFIPLATSPDDVIRLARRALAPNGRLVAGVGHTAAAVALARRLRLNGFSAPHSIHLSDLILLRASTRRPS